MDKKCASCYWYDTDNESRLLSSSQPLCVQMGNMYVSSINMVLIVICQKKIRKLTTTKNAPNSRKFNLKMWTNEKYASMLIIINSS